MFKHGYGLVRDTLNCSQHGVSYGVWTNNNSILLKNRCYTFVEHATNWLFDHVNNAVQRVIPVSQGATNTAG
jgi:hypothetical protein